LTAPHLIVFNAVQILIVQSSPYTQARPAEAVSWALLSILLLDPWRVYKTNTPIITSNSIQEVNVSITIIDGPNIMEPKR
jgi:hypothetical protein